MKWKTIGWVSERNKQLINLIKQLNNEHKFITIIKNDPFEIISKLSMLSNIFHTFTKKTHMSAEAMTKVKIDEKYSYKTNATC